MLSEILFAEGRRERAQVRMNMCRMVRLSNHYSPPGKINAQKNETDKD